MTKLRLGIISPIMGQATVEPFRNMVSISHQLSNQVYSIEILGDDAYISNQENNVSTKRIYHKSGKVLFSRIFNYIVTQFRSAYEVAILSSKVNLWVFFMGDSLLLPIFVAKFMRKKIFLIMGGSIEKEFQMRNDEVAKFLILFKRLTLALSTCVIVFSPCLLKTWHLEKYKNKTYFAHNHLIDFNKFKILKSYTDRKNIVGYIGRMNEEKGIINFISAIPLILKKRTDVTFLIGGDGSLRKNVEQMINEMNLRNNVQLIGWIPHDALPIYLNDLKLIVLPSYTEGLPNIVIEAMACGTPVLVTPVGSIPDIVKNNENGFIMANNSPECIARNIIRSLNHPYLEQVAQNACIMVKKEFNFEKTVASFREIFNKF